MKLSMQGLPGVRQSGIHMKKILIEPLPHPILKINSRQIIDLNADLCLCGENYKMGQNINHKGKC